MLTQAQNQAARAAAADFSAACADYRAVLAHHKLPLTVDLSQVESIYRGRLFEQLLAADAGLRARYDMAQTKEGKQRIQADTMAGISLAGHELPEQVSEALAELERAHRALPLLNDVPRLPLGTLASGYGLDYGQVLDQFTMSWQGKEQARAYFEQLAVTLTQWRNLIQASSGLHSYLPDLFEQMTRPFEQRVPDSGPIVLDEHKLYQHLQNNPQLLDMLRGPAVSRPA